MSSADETCSLTDFQRNARKHVRQLKKSGRPQVLTVNGRAELVVLNAQAFQRLLEQINRAEAIEGIRRGLADVAAGRAQPARVALERLRKRLTGRQNG